METIDIIIALLLLTIIIVLLCKDFRTYSVEGMSNEAIHNLSSMYHDGILKVTKLQADSIDINNDLKVNGNINSDNENIVLNKNLHVQGSDITLNNDASSFIFRYSKDSNSQKKLMMAFKNDAQDSWDWDKSNEISSNGDLTVYNSVTAGNAKMGSWGNNDHAFFGAKDAEVNDYALLQGNNENNNQTILNSANRIIMKRNNDSQKSLVELAALRPARSQIEWNYNCLAKNIESIPEIQNGDIVFGVRRHDGLSVLHTKYNDNMVSYKGIGPGDEGSRNFVTDANGEVDVGGANCGF